MIENILRLFISQKQNIMKKSVFTLVFILSLLLSGEWQLNGQDSPAQKVDFKNAPVLFKEGGKSYQQVVASYRSDKAGKIVITRWSRTPESRPCKG
jgi:hypothetical protein